jgi:hypothetical protein
MTNPSRPADFPFTGGARLQCRGVAATVPIEMPAGTGRALGRFVVGALLAASLAACSVGHSISASEAQKSAADQLRAAAGAVFPPGFTLEPLPPQSLNCTTWAGSTTGQVVYGVTFWVNGVDSAKNNTYFDSLKAWWLSHRWILQDDSRPADPFMNATHPDGYLMSLRANFHKRMTIGSTTPCVRPEAASEATGAPSDPLGDQPPPSASSQPRPP